MNDKIDSIIAKSWLEGSDPADMLAKAGVKLPESYEIPAKPNFMIGATITRDSTNHANDHHDCAYCYCG